MSKVRRSKKDSWSWKAFWTSIYWYASKGMVNKAAGLLLIILFTWGIGLLPVMFYCGRYGRKDYYNYLKPYVNLVRTSKCV